jgi:uracil-DNA glycosylase
MLETSWKEALGGEFKKDYFKELHAFVKQEREDHVIFPPRDQVFSAFNACPVDKVKVVILGQDPYHNADQAHGMSFSVKKGVKVPPSLVNIYKELESDLGIPRAKHGNLQHWADQGVLLLNATLTVRAHEAGSHQKKGWETLTDHVIEFLGDHPNPMVFVLWGRYARSKARFIDVNHNLVVESAHPSPLSANGGFFGSKPFSKVNEGLEFMGLDPIDWRVPE